MAFGVWSVRRGRVRWGGVGGSGWGEAGWGGVGWGGKGVDGMGWDAKYSLRSTFYFLLIPHCRLDHRARPDKDRRTCLVVADSCVCVNPTDEERQGSR